MSFYLLSKMYIFIYDVNNSNSKVENYDNIWS